MVDLESGTVNVLTALGGFATAATGMLWLTRQFADLREFIIDKFQAMEDKFDGRFASKHSQELQQKQIDEIKSECGKMADRIHKIETHRGTHD